MEQNDETACSNMAACCHGASMLVLICCYSTNLNVGEMAAKVVKSRAIVSLICPKLEYSSVCN
jgi:hypothetical protein